MKKIITKERFYLGMGLLSLIVGLTILIIFIIKLSDYYSFSSESNKIKIEDTGSVGDFIGGVIGTFLTFSSIFFIILTFLKQQEAIVTQKKQFDIQQFENKYFQLLKVQQDIVNSIEIKIVVPEEGTIPEKEYIVHGLNAFEFIYNRLKQQYFKIQSISLPNQPIPIEMKSFFFSEEQEQLQKIQETFEKVSLLIEVKDIKKLTTPIKISRAAYSLIFSTYHGQLGHYFRHLYHILKFLNQSYINELSKSKSNSRFLEQKYKSYSDLIQAQMNSYQLAILFYNGLCFKEMKKLLHHYNFLENLAIQDIISEEHNEFYAETEIDGAKYPAILLKNRNRLIE